MKLFNVSLFTLLSFNLVFSQSQSYSVKYRQILNLTPNVSADSTGEEVTLLHKGNTSFYVRNRIESDTIKDDRIVTIKDDANPLDRRRIRKDRTGIGVYKDFDSSKLIIRELVGKSPYLITESFPKFDWHIEPDKKNIGGFDCQKATVTHKGRQYTAWFTTKIPSSDGPWKFYGLPGLILEIKDSERKVEFVFTSISFDKDINFIKPVVGVQMSSEEELKTLRRKLTEDIVRKAQSGAPKSSNVTITISQPELIEKIN